MNDNDGGPLQDHELQAQHGPNADDQHGRGRGATQELKPADRGRDAWVILIAGFILEALFWGFPMCFGVFQDYYSKVPAFQKDSANIPLIGTIAQSLYYLGAPLSALVTKRYPKYQRQQIWLGWPMCILGLLGASFTTSVIGLIMTQGLLNGLGFVTLTYPIISMINEWWIVRKGMAFGLISASSGATGAVMPFIIEALLAKYGYQITLRACAVAMIILSGPLIPLFKSRLPVTDSVNLARTDWSFLKKPLFWVYSVAILSQGMGFFYPIVFLPSFATSVGLSSLSGAILLAIMSIAQVFGQCVLGYLSDNKLPVNVLAVGCCVISAVGAFTLWGLAHSMALLAIFSLIHGFFAFGFGTLRVAMGKNVSDDASTVFATYAIFVFLQGIGNILVSPISAALMTPESDARQYGAGSYSKVVLLTGSTSLFAAITILAWFLAGAGIRKL
ncbi:hypothetical protein E8E14_012623 [Neopestalotiopsis sp. 37M]|nr:hypothetical protein E8E14_012623 [Neopestalotiopsis sp. 37M]